MPPGRRAQQRIRFRSTVGLRLVLAGVLGVVVGVVVGVVLHAGSIAPVTGWITAAAAFLIVTWATIGRMGSDATASHATREDPTVRASDLVLLLASVASLGGVVLLLADPDKDLKALAPVLAVGSVAASWFLVHTLFTLRYAALYYRGPDGGIDFNQKGPPDYADFAYLAFTLGMTYQVSDTDLTDSTIRHTVLRHSLLAYLLGAVVLAATINLVAGLGG